MNKNLNLAITATIAALATFFTLIFSGIGTTSIIDVEGHAQTLTTLNLSPTEFITLTIAVVLISILATGLALNKATKN